MVYEKLLAVLAQRGDPETQLDNVVNQLSLDMIQIRDQLREAVSSNDQQALSNAFNQFNTYTRVLEWAASPGVDWTQDEPELGAPPGQPGF